MVLGGFLNTVNIAIIGGGKMGLPLACMMAENGGSVIVCDINSQLVSKINACKVPFNEPMLTRYMNSNVQDGRLRATTDTTKAVAGAEVVIVIVPAILTSQRDIDYTNLVMVSEDIARGLKPGTLVSYETTLPVGGCRSILVPILEKSKLKAGTDFYVSFSPERVKSQYVFERLRKTPKIVGGYDPSSTRMAVQFYSKYLDVEVIDVETLEGAEFIKLAGMIYRDVNIALVNELAMFCENNGLDIFKTIAAANTDGETFMLTPGIGVGGHCTPVYPYFFINASKQMGISQILAASARKINEEQPKRNIDRLEQYFGTLKDKSIHILGVAFRPQVKEHTYSPAFALKYELLTRGASTTVEDHLYSDKELVDLGFVPAKLGINKFDAVVLNTAHDVYKEGFDFSLLGLSGVKVVLDGRNWWSEQDVKQAGVSYLCVGKKGQ